MSPDELEAIVNKLVPSCDYATITLTPLAASGAANRRTIVMPNPKRKGLVIYNNCANSIYVSYSDDVNSATKMTLIIPTFAHWIMDPPIYRGIMSAMKNAGTTGSVIVTELT